MKGGRLSLLLLCSLVLVFLGGVKARKPILGAVWSTWKVLNNKTYPSLREERLRIRIFQSNYMFSRWHNMRYNNGLESYHTALNKFSDLTLREFAQQYLTYIPRDGKLSSWKGNRIRLFDTRTRAPDSVDWRKQGLVTPVKDQRQCGSCWAFSATGALEGQIKKKTGQLISFSEQQLVDCSRKQGNMGCNGGLMDNAFKYWKLFGAENEASYSYKARDGRCKYNRKLVVANVTGFTDVQEGSEEQLQLSVASVGPVSVAIDASGSGFQMYSGGVYVDDHCSPENLDHGVLAVGYDVDKNGNEFWIVKNSWGEDWGLHGYIWMARNKGNMCGIATAASYPTV